jgi:hypothetical protein
MRWHCVIRNPTSRIISFVSAAIAGAALALGAWSIGSTQEATEFWNQEWQRNRGSDAGWGRERWDGWRNRQSGWDDRRSGWWGEPADDEPSARITVRPRRDAEAARAAAAGHYCVRTCDGFYFPLSRARRSHAEAQSLCEDLCPAAETHAYSLRSDAESFAEARSRRGQPYSRLAAAFAYRDSLKPGCSCRSAEKPGLTLRDDPTLKAGDIVVTEQGVRVFRGGARPHAARDFVDYRRQVPRATRAYLDAIDKPYRAARAEPPAQEAMAAGEISSSRKSQRRRSARDRRR